MSSNLEISLDWWKKNQIWSLRSNALPNFKFTRFNLPMKNEPLFGQSICQFAQWPTTFDSLFLSFVFFLSVTSHRLALTCKASSFSFSSSFLLNRNSTTKHDDSKGLTVSVSIETVAWVWQFRSINQSKRPVPGIDPFVNGLGTPVGQVAAVNQSNCEQSSHNIFQ